MKILFSIGLCLMIVGGGFYLQQQHEWNSLKRDPLNFPIHLSPGMIETPSFLTSNIPYRIRLVFSGHGDEREKLRCLIGVKDFDSDPPCPDQDPLDISWTVTKNGSAFGSGRLEGIYDGSPFFGRYLGGFQGETNARLSLSIRINKAASELNSLAPRIEVEYVSGPEPYTRDPDQDFLLLVFTIGTLSGFNPQGYKSTKGTDCCRSEKLNALSHPQS